MKRPSTSPTRASSRPSAPGASSATSPSRRSSTTAATRAPDPASASAASKTRAIALRRRSGLNTLPTAVFGSSATISTYFGTAAGSAICARACAISSSAVAVAPAQSST